MKTLVLYELKAKKDIIAWLINHGFPSLESQSTCQVTQNSTKGKDFEIVTITPIQDLTNIQYCDKLVLFGSFKESDLDKIFKNVCYL